MHTHQHTNTPPLPRYAVCRYDVWLAGTDPTYADLALFLKLEAKVTIPLELGRKPIGTALPFPKLSGLFEEVRLHPNVYSYLTSGRRMPRVEKRSTAEGGGHDYYYVDAPAHAASAHAGEL